MNAREAYKRVLLAISVITVISGAVQGVMPGLILPLLSAESTPTGRHFFGIVGMFMVLFGGMLWHALGQSPTPPLPVLWAGFQKFGAALAVGLGVRNGIFSSLALGVAGFDLLSGVAALLYWHSIKDSL